MEADDKITILVADGHSLFREALTAVLNAEPDLEVVGEARDGLTALTEAQIHHPDVAMLDVNLPNSDITRTISAFKQQVVSCRVLVLADEEDLSVLTDSIVAGADGYLSKESPMTELITAARGLARGEVLVPPRLLGGLLNTLLGNHRRQDQLMRMITRLTRREREVLALLAEGCDNDAIAEALVISPQTARTHIQNILSKLGVHSRLEAAALVIQNNALRELQQVV